MEKLNEKQDAGLIVLAIRVVIGWTYFSAFWRRTILANKLDPDAAGYIGEKFNHFLPNALGIKPLIQYLVENPDILWLNMLIFTIVEGIVGLFLMFGMFTRLMGIGVFFLALGILLGSGWIGTTCLDEWQIGVLGLATGFVLFLSGSGKYAIDHYWIKKNLLFTKKRWFLWLGSGELPLKQSVFSKLVVTGTIFVFGMTLMTNQIFHGGVWGTLHNKSVKPKLEISSALFVGEKLSFDLFRTEGVDVYGSWVIGIELLDQNEYPILTFTQEDLAGFNQNNISNYYVAKIKHGKHSLVVPLGAKANLALEDERIATLPMGNYLLRITDISGAYWEELVFKQ